MTMSRFSAISSVFVAVSMLGVSGASAQGNTYPMIGKAAHGSGLFIRLPAAGFAACPSITALRTASPTQAPQNDPFMGTVNSNVVLNAKGCIPGGALRQSAAAVSVQTNGTGGFMLPAMFFYSPFPGSLQVNPIPNDPMVVQLASSFFVSGPNMLSSAYEGRYAVRAAPPLGELTMTVSGGNGMKFIMGSSAALAPWNVLKHNAHVNQSGRLGAMFTACAAVNASTIQCANPQDGNQIPGIVKYAGGAGGNFGGTTGLILRTSAVNETSVAVTVDDLVAGGILFARVAGMGSRAPGRGYAIVDTDYLMIGDVYSAYMLTTYESMVSEKVIGMVTGLPNTGVPGTNNNYGFPFTTGTVLIRGTGSASGGVPVGGTFSLKGFDNRATSMAEGTIQLVAGHLAQSTIQSDSGTPNYMIFRLPEPRGHAPLIAGALGLLAVVAWRARKTR